jgi:hypothetical protein
MFAADLIEGGFRRRSATMRYIVQALTDAFAGVGTGSEVEEALVGFGILHDGCRLAVDRQNHRTLGLSQLLHEVAGSPTKRRQRLDVFRDVHQKVLTAPYKVLPEYTYLEEFIPRD